MRKILLALGIVALFAAPCYPQCAGYGSAVANIGLPPCGALNGGTTLSPAQFITVNLTTGINYTFETCGSSNFDAYLNVFNGATRVVTADDECASSQPSLTWTSTFTNTAAKLVVPTFSQRDVCSSPYGWYSGMTSTVLRVRQNTGVSNTTAAGNICAGGTKTLTASLTGTHSSPAISWSVVGGPGAGGISPLTGASVTFTATNPGAVTVRATVGSCFSDHTFTIHPAYAAGAISGGTGTSTQCSSFNPGAITSNPTGGAGTYTRLWQQSSNGTTWVTATGTSNGTTYDPPALTATTHYRYTVDATGSPDCGGVLASTNTYVYTILPAFAAGAITGGTASSTQCNGFNPGAITSNPTGGAGTYTRLWQQSSNGTTWVTATGTSNGTTYDPPALTATTHYRYIVDATGSPDCGGFIASTNTYVYTILPTYAAGAITGGTGTSTQCNGFNPAAISSNPVGGAGTYTRLWQQSSNGTTWVDATGTNNGTTYDPPALTATTHYRYTVDATGSPDCGGILASTNTYVYTILPSYAPGAITGGTASSTQCSGFNPAAITSNPVGGVSYTRLWQQSSNGTTWVNASGTNNAVTYDPPALTATTHYRYTIDATGSPDCGGVLASTNTYVYTILPAFAAGAISGGTASSTQCNGFDPGVITSNPTGGTGTYTRLWQQSSNGTTWVNATGTNDGNTYDPPALTATTHYRYTVDATGSPDCGVVTASTNTYVYTILPAYSAGAITGGTGTSTQCYNFNPGAITSNPVGGVTYTRQWQQSSNGTTWSVATGTSNGTTYDPPALTATTHYRYTVDATGVPDCGGVIASTNTYVYTILPNFAAGAISGGTGTSTQCYNFNPPVITSNPVGATGTYTYLWQQSANGTTWVNATGTNNTATYDPPALTATTHYRYTVDPTGSPDCAVATASSNTYVYTILPNYAAGAITGGTGTSTQCFNFNPGIVTANPVGGASYTYLWQQSSNGTTWTDASGTNNSNTYDPPVLTTTTHYRYTVDATGVPDCGGVIASTNTYVYTIVPAFASGAISGGTASSTQCYSFNPGVITANPVGGSGTYVYLWQQSANGTTWANATGTNNTVNYDPPALTATTHYRYTVDPAGSPDCGVATASTNTYVYTILPNYAAGAITGGTGTSTQCYNFNPVAITSNPVGGAGTYTRLWQESSNGTTWVDASGTNNAVTYDPPALTATTHYRYTVDATGVPDCGGVIASTNTYVYTILPSYAAGAITGGTATSTQCYNFNPGVISANPVGGISYIYLWQQSSNGTTWVNATGTITGATYDPPALTATTHYRYTVDASGSPDCGAVTASTNTYVYTILPNFAVGAITGGTATSTQCYNFDPGVITANPTGGTGTFTYLWQQSSNGTTWVNATGTNNVSTYDPPALTTTTHYRYTVDATGSPDCGGFVASATRVYTILPNFLAGAISGGTGTSTQCINFNPGVISSNPTGGAGTYTGLWQQSSNGTTWVNATGTNNAATYDPPVLTATTHYRYTVDAIGSPDCGGFIASTNTYIYTILPVYATGAISGGTGTSTQCYNFNPGVISANPVGGISYTYLWQQSANGTTWANASGTNNAATYDPPVLTSTTHYRYTVDATGSPDCGVLGASTNTYVYTILPNYDPGAITGGTGTSSQCYNFNPGPINANPVGGVSYSYLWQQSADGSTWANATGTNNTATYDPPSLITTTHYRYLVDATGSPDCGVSVPSTNTYVYTIFPPAPVISSVVTTNVSSCVIGDGSIVISATGTGTLSYSIDNGSTTQASNTFTGLNDGIPYNVVVYDGNNCPTSYLSNPVILTGPSTVVANSVITNDVTCAGGGNGTITLSGISGGTAPYSYGLQGLTSTEWIEFTTDPYVIDSLGAIAYQVIVRDAFDCRSVQNNLTVTEPAALLITSFSITNISGCGGSGSGAITVNAAGGTGTRNFYLNGNINSPATSNSWSSLVAGNYDVTVTDANGCSTAGIATITAPWIANAGNEVAICSGGSSQLAGGIIGELPKPTTVSCSSSCTLLTTHCASVAQSSNGTNERITNVTFGSINQTSVNSTYTNYTGTQTTNVVRGTAYTLSVTHAHSTTAVRFLRAYIDWNRDGDFADNNETYVLWNANIASGTYTRTLAITVPDDAVLGNTRMRIGLKRTPDFAAGSCGNPFTGYGEVEDYNLNVQTTGTNASYSWSPSGGLSATNIANPVANPTTTTTYTLTVNDGNSCVQNSTVTVNVSDHSSTANITNVSCNGGSDGCAIINPVDGVGPYLMKRGSIFQVFGGSMKPVTITNAVGNGALANFPVKISGIAYTAPMRADFGDVRFFDANFNLIPFWIESYTLSSTATIWVKMASLPTGNTTIYMVFGNASLSTSSNGTNVFEFFDDFNYYDATKWTQSKLLLHQIPSGATWRYSAGTLIGGNNNWWQQSTATFTGNRIAETRIYETTPITNGFSSLHFFGSTSNGVGILSHNGTSYYQHDGAFPASLAWASQNRWVRDYVRAIGANSVASRTSETGTPTPVSWTFTNSGLSAERLRLGPRGDNGQYNQSFTASWDWIFVRSYAATEPSASVGAVVTSDNSFCGLAMGAYTINVVDMAGCIQNVNFNITQPTLLSASVSFIPASCYANDGTIDLTPAGGTPTYLYSWTGPGGFTSGIQDPATLIPGNYSVTVADQNTCTANASVTVTQLTPITSGFYTWTGNSNSQWQLYTNWDCGVSNTTSRVIIPGAPVGLSLPVINNITGDCWDIEVQGSTPSLLSIQGTGVLNIHRP